MLWDVPTLGSRPHDPLATKDGAIWWTGQLVQQARPRRSQDRRDPGILAQDAAQRAARPDRGQGRQHLVHRQQCRLHRQARSEDRPGDRIPDARPQGARYAHADLRSRRHPVVHRAAGQHGRPARSQDRRDQARHLADAEIAALRHGGEFQERRALRRVRRQQDRDHRQQDDGDQGIPPCPIPARGRAASRSRPTT